jgi:DNA-binding NtrC family response regulator
MARPKREVLPMTHVLVVHHDPDMADEETDWLRRAGYGVVECSGPARGPCPILNDEPCSAVDAADVLVYDVWASGNADTERELIARLRELHPTIPIVLTAPGIELNWEETRDAAGVVSIAGALTAATLANAVERAIESIVQVR